MNNTFQLLPDRSHELFKQLPAGSTIINTDTINAVWVSEGANVAANSGYRLGPLGTLKWQKTSDIWACVDDGVTTTVTLTIGDNLDQLNNPVDIATATALQLFAQGIPNIFRQDLLFSGTIPTLSSGVEIDVTSYASLTVVSNQVGNATTTYMIECLDINGVNLMSYTVNDLFWITILSLPVTYPKIRIYSAWTGGGVDNSFKIYGSNREVPAAAIMNTDNNVRMVSSAAIAAGGERILGRSRKNGISTACLDLSGSVAPLGYLSMRNYNTVGTAMNSLVTNTYLGAINGNNNIQTFSPAAPLTPVHWVYTSLVADATLAINLHIIGA